MTSGRWWLVLFCAVVLAGCGKGGEASGPVTSEPPATEPAPAPPATEPAPSTEPAPPATALPVSLVHFGDYVPVPLTDPDAPAYPGPATPTSLDGVTIASEVRTALAAPGATEALLEHGFVVVPSDLRLFHFAYEGSRYAGWPVFVTTDAAYHTWHLVFDKVLRTLEQRVLLPKLESLVSRLLDAAGAQAAELAGTPLEDDASRVEQLFQVAAAELGLSATLGPLASAEKALVDAHSAQERSPILDTTIDYSLFTPRGHYTRNAALTRYFVAMSVLGQSAFCLPDTSDCSGVEPARRAVLASRVLAASPDLVALWRDLYEPTAFLVGLADDYTPLEVADAAGSALDDPTVLADDAAVSGIADGLLAARPVLIDPDRASIRLMGTRFVIDSYVLDQLVYPNVGTEEKPRSLPSALDIAAAFGSEFAEQALAQEGETDYEGYDAQLESMRAAIAGRAAGDWGSTVYDAWLSALEPSFVAHGEAFPDFMRDDAWSAKALQSGLGSYAELKHDTILYTKQAVAEGGDGLPIPERRNWVEPEPAAFGRLAAVTDLLLGGLDQRQLLRKEERELLRDASELFRFFEQIAAGELAGTPISEVDNERLTDIGGELEAFFWRTSDRTAGGETEADQDAAVIADIASSRVGEQGILEVGTGRIDRIYVLVPDDQGAFQVAAGGVYSYYEFANPPGTRLTDEEWRASLDAGEQPERPAWEQSILAG
jgi:hypothetical protein